MKTHCFEPAFVQAPEIGEAQIIDLHWQEESRRSVLLSDLQSCHAVINNPQAFVLTETPRERVAHFPELTERTLVINQAALDCVTLQGISDEMRLYALGVMLATANESEDSPASREKIAAMPKELAKHAASGGLQQMFVALPLLPHLQRKLISQLGEMTFDWSVLEESPRKASLSVQMILLSLQDENSEALMQQQLNSVWQDKAPETFTIQPWTLMHYLVYRLYHECFPRHTHLSLLENYLQLVSDYFQLRSLFSLWMLDGSTLSRDDATALICLFERARLSVTPCAVTHPLFAGNELLAAISLLSF